MRMIKASWLRKVGVPVGRKGPDTELGWCVTEELCDHPENCWLCDMYHTKDCFQLLDVFLAWVRESEPEGLSVCGSFTQWGMKEEDIAERGEMPLVVFDVLKLPRNKTVHIFRTQTMPEISVIDPTRSYILWALKCTSSGVFLLQGRKGILGKCRHPLLPWPPLRSVTNLWVNTELSHFCLQ